MSVAGGPKLGGIGPGAAPEIVMCLDAPDAGSYPGEPTTNVCPFTLSDSGTDGSGQGSVGVRVLLTDNHVRIFDNVSNTRQTFLIYGLTASTTYTISTLYKKLNGTPTFRYQIQAHDGATYLRVIKFTNTAETGIEDKEGWQLASWTFVLSSDANAVRIWFQDGADYTTYTHSFELKNPQLEAKPYATPFVREPWNYFGGGNARPASVDLMIHGDVGTGTSFEDSSPSKHTVTATGSMAHSSTQSKFPGGSIYSPSADYLNVTSSDFAFGTINWTIDFWVNQSTTLGWASPVDTYGTSGNGFILGFDGSTNYLAFYSENGIGWANAYGSHAGTSFALTNGTWYHVAYVRNGNAFTCYVNGAVYFTATLSGSDDYTSTGLRVGQRGNGQGSYEGYLDEVRVCRGTALWIAAFTPPTRRNRSAPVVDLSGSDTGGNFNTTDPTDVVTYRVGEVIRPIANAYWNFDGTDDRMKLPSQNDAQALCAWGDFTGADNTNYSICMWVLSGGPQGNSTLDAPGLLARSDGDIYANLTIYNGVICFVHYNGSWLFNIISVSIEDSKWHHVAYVNTSSQIGTLYIDGVQQNYGESSSISAGSYFSPDYIGYGYNNKYFLGQIAAAQVYQAALTSSQIKQSFNAQCGRFGVGPPEISTNGLIFLLDPAKAPCFKSGDTTAIDLIGGKECTGANGSPGSGTHTGNSADMPVWNSVNGGVFDFVGGKGMNVQEDLGQHGASSQMMWFYKTGTNYEYFTDARNNGGSWFLSNYDSFNINMHGNLKYNFGGGSYSTSPAGWLNNWHCMVTTSDGSGSVLYLDGELISPAANSSYSENFGINFRIGTRYTSSGDWAGKMGPIALYNRKISAEEASQFFQAYRERFSI